jgi:hypothetical protein
VNDDQLTPQGDEDQSTDVDRFPTFHDVLTRLLDDEKFEGALIERLEITTLATGEATYRYWPPKAQEAEGGYYEAV